VPPDVPPDVLPDVPPWLLSGILEPEDVPAPLDGAAPDVSGLLMLPLLLEGLVLLGEEPVVEPDDE